MEPRSAIGDYDAKTDRYTLHAGCQGVFGLKHQLADLLDDHARQGARADRQCRRLVRHEGLGLSRVRPAAATPRKMLGRPVKWTDERSESFLSDHHGRDHEFDGRAGARQGRQVPRRAAHRLRPMSAPIIANVGPLMATDSVVKNLVDVYRTPLIEVAIQGRVHQHHAGRRLSRRRPARGQLLHGAADRHGGARDGHRPRRAAPAQPHHARRRCPTRRRRA